MALDQKKRSELYEEWRRRGKLRPTQWRQVGRMAKTAIARRVAEIEKSGALAGPPARHLSAGWGNLAAPPLIVDIPLRKFRPPDAHLSQREPAATSALGAEVASANATPISKPSPTLASLFDVSAFGPGLEPVPEYGADALCDGNAPLKPTEDLNGPPEPSTYTWQELADARDRLLADEKLEMRAAPPRPWRVAHSSLLLA